MIFQPFYVGNNPRFRGVSVDGYLPAYVSCDESIHKPDNDDTKHQEPEWIWRQWDYVQQLKGQMLHLEKKVMELSQQKPIRKSKYD